MLATENALPTIANRDAVAPHLTANADNSPIVSPAEYSADVVANFDKPSPAFSAIKSPETISPAPKSKFIFPFDKVIFTS